MMEYDYPYPISRSHQYKKITKPMLERKRRARINRCLEELKDLMVDVLETEVENISKLEKADILEITVRYLQQLQASRPSTSLENTLAESHWQSGFGQCAAEACKYLASLPGELSEKLACHLASGLQSKRTISTPMLNLQDSTFPIINQDVINYKVDPQCSWESSSTSSSLSITPRLTFSPIDSSQNLLTEKCDEFNNNNNLIKKNILPLNSQVPDEEKERPEKSESVIKNINHDNLLSKTVILKQINDNDEEDDEEIEIDVEKIDDTDTVWRPW